MRIESLNSGYVMIEGLDFTGKTTVARKLADRFSSDGPIKAVYHHGYFSNFALDSRSLTSSVGKESVYKNLYESDKREGKLPADLVIQDRYFPSILFYGKVVNASDFPSTQEIQDSYILPRGVLLFERSFKEICDVSGSRKQLSSLERLAITSELQYRHMQEQYRELIDRLGIWHTTVDTTQTPEEETTRDCHETLLNSGVLIENVSVEKLCVSWEPRVYLLTAEKYATKIRAGEQVEPLVVYRKFNEEIGVSLDLVEDGRHRAYAHHLANVATARAFVQRIPVGIEEINSIDPIKLKDFSFK